ncbi:AAA family ATPase [Pseudolysinimonas sp.]|uniref:AAA family ATPase n=1 Tax=Pseudolysinimonas sp. TaxID=2680009 RepID=UPI003F8043B9
MTDVALALPLAEEETLAADAARHGHRIVARCSGGDELATRLAAADPELVVCGAAPQYLSPRLLDACDRRGVRLVALAAGPTERRQAAVLGLVDVLEAPAGWEAIVPSTGGRAVDLAGADPAEEILVRPVGRAPERGRVIAVWGPAGAPGRTSVAIALAAEFALRGSKVALADADTHGAAIAPALGLLDEAPGFAAACRLVAGGALTNAELDRIAQPHGTGTLRVLTGIGRASRWPELGADRVEGVLAALREWAPVTVVDTAASLEEDEELSSDLVAPRRNAATLAALRAADRVVAVASADPVGLARYLRVHADLLELVGPDRVVTVVNKVRASAIGLGPAAQVRQTLARFGGVRDPLLVPWDLAAFDAALLSGRPVGEAAPRSAASAAIRELADRLAPDPAPAVRRPRRFRRAS